MMNSLTIMRYDVLNILLTAYQLELCLDHETENSERTIIQLQKLNFLIHKRSLWRNRPVLLWTSVSSLPAVILRTWLLGSEHDCTSDHGFYSLSLSFSLRMLFKKHTQKKWYLPPRQKKVCMLTENENFSSMSADITWASSHGPREGLGIGFQKTKKRKY